MIFPAIVVRGGLREYGAEERQLLDAHAIADDCMTSSGPRVHMQMAGMSLRHPRELEKLLLTFNAQLCAHVSALSHMVPQDIGTSETASTMNMK